MERKEGNFEQMKKNWIKEENDERETKVEGCSEIFERKTKNF